MKKLISLALVAALAVGAFAGCGTAASQSGAASTAEQAQTPAAPAAAKTLRIALKSDIETMDIHKTSNDYMVPLNIYDRLFEIKLNADGTTELQKSLVDDYSVSADGLTYSFTLKSGITCSDGTPFTANDVKYTFTRMLALPDSVQTDFGSAILGAEAVMDGSAKDLEGVKVTDDTHFTITLSMPFAGFLYQLATPSCSMYSESKVEAAGDAFGMDPAKTIGTGPYVVTSWTHNSQITLKRNPNYWGTAPDVENVVISIVPDSSTMSMMYQNGELDVLDLDNLDSAVVDSTYKTQYADKLVYANRLALTYFTFNETVAPFDNVQVRKAVQMAIDRETLLKTVYSGNGNLEDGIYPHGLIGYSEANQGWLKYDPEGAKKLLAEAGYPNGFTMELAADSSGSDSTLLMYQIIQQNLADVGITATIKSYDQSSWLDLRKSGSMSSYISTWTADYNDPDNFIYTFFGNADKTKIRSLNYANTDAMQQINDVRAIVDDTTRLAKYAELEKTVVEQDAAWLPLFSRQHLFALGDNVKSYVPHWAGYGDFFFCNLALNS